MNKLTLPLLGALSSTEIAEDNPLEQKLNRLRSLIDSAIIPALRASSYVGKSRLERSLERCINDTATLCGLPRLLGRACVGIVAGETPLKPIWTALEQTTGNPGDRRISLPYLIMHENEYPRIQAFSLSGKTISLGALENHPQGSPETLTQEEYETLLDLSGDGINSRDVVSALLYFTPLRRPASSYLLLPPDEFGRQGSGKLIAQCNAMIICGAIADPASLEALRNDFTMPVHIMADNEADVQPLAAWLKSRYAGRQVEIHETGELDTLLDRLDGYVERITLHDRLLSEMLRVEEELSVNIARRATLDRALKRDSVFFTGGENNLDELLEKSQKDLRQSIKNLEKEKKNFSAACQDTLAEASAV